MREASEHLLSEYIPHLKGAAKLCSEESRALANQLEAHIRQHLKELEVYSQRSYTEKGAREDERS